MKALRALAGAAVLASASIAAAIDTASAAPTGCTSYTDRHLHPGARRGQRSTGYVSGAVCNGVLRYGGYVASRARCFDLLPDQRLPDSQDLHLLVPLAPGRQRSRGLVAAVGRRTPTRVRSTQRSMFAARAPARPLPDGAVARVPHRLVMLHVRCRADLYLVHRRGLRHDDQGALTLARRWSKVAAVLLG